MKQVKITIAYDGKEMSEVREVPEYFTPETLNRVVKNIANDFASLLRNFEGEVVGSWEPIEQQEVDDDF